MYARPGSALADAVESHGHLPSMALLQFSEDDRRLYFCAYIFELFESLFLICLSMFVLKVVRKCAALHANLRVIY